MRHVDDWGGRSRSLAGDLDDLDAWCSSFAERAEKGETLFPWTGADEEARVAYDRTRAYALKTAREARVND